MTFYSALTIFDYPPDSVNLGWQNLAYFKSYFFV
jgi:hypothetical protein